MVGPAHSTPTSDEGWTDALALKYSLLITAVAPVSFLQQAHDKTLVTINNHLVNGKGNDLDGSLSGGGLDEGRLNLLKEEILRELERRVSLSCSSCQVPLISH